MSIKVSVCQKQNPEERYLVVHFGSKPSDDLLPLTRVVDTFTFEYFHFRYLMMAIEIIADKTGFRGDISKLVNEAYAAGSTHTADRPFSQISQKGEYPSFEKIAELLGEEHTLFTEISELANSVFKARQLDVRSSA